MLTPEERLRLASIIDVSKANIQGIFDEGLKPGTVLWVAEKLKEVNDGEHKAVDRVIELEETIFSLRENLVLVEQDNQRLEASVKARDAKIKSDKEYIQYLLKDIVGLKALKDILDLKEDRSSIEELTKPRDQCPYGMSDGWGHLHGPDCTYKK